MKYKAVIFDLDGTLVDSIEDLAESMNAILDEYNLPKHPADSYYGMVGMGIRKLVESALPETHRSDDFIDECFSKMKVLYEKNIVNKTAPYKGIVELLETLINQEVKLNVLSNKADNLTKKVVNNIFSKFDFEFILGPETSDLRKPNPENALQIAKSLGLSPEDVVFIGDTAIDIKTAINASMTAVGVSWGFRTKEELENAGADHVIDTPMELFEVLG